MARFATKDTFAGYNGTASIDSSFGEQARQRLSRAGTGGSTGPALTPGLADQAIVDLATGDEHGQDASVLTAAGLRSLS